MKKAVVLMLAFVLLCAAIPAFAEEGEEFYESKFEHAMKQKGILHYLEIKEIGSIEKTTFYSLSLKNVQTGDRIYAVMCGNMYLCFDEDEVDGVISALEYYKNTVPEYTTTEIFFVSYISNGGVLLVAEETPYTDSLFMSKITSEFSAIDLLNGKDQFSGEFSFNAQTKIKLGTDAIDDLISIFQRAKESFGN